MAQTKSPTKRTPPKAYMRWPHLIRKNILEMVLDIHSITPIRHDLPEFDQLSKFIREDDQGIQILDGESPVIADLTERFARAVQNSPFQYTWQPNHGPNRGERLWNNYDPRQGPPCNGELRGANVEICERVQPDVRKQDPRNCKSIPSLPGRGQAGIRGWTQRAVHRQVTRQEEENRTGRHGSRREE